MPPRLDASAGPTSAVRRNQRVYDQLTEPVLMQNTIQPKSIVAQGMPTTFQNSSDASTVDTPLTRHARRIGGGISLGGAGGGFQFVPSPCNIRTPPMKPGTRAENGQSNSTQ